MGQYSDYVEAVAVLLCISKEIDDYDAISYKLDLSAEDLDELLEILKKLDLVKIYTSSGKLSLTRKGNNVVKYYLRNPKKSGNAPSIHISPRY
jgi:hypothetical protein